MKLGLVEKLLKGQDKVTRGALVKLAPKNGKPSLLHRPIQWLYPLEVNQEAKERPSTTDEGNAAEPPEVSDNITSETLDEGNSQGRPKRAAARREGTTLDSEDTYQHMYVTLLTMLGGGCWKFHLIFVITQSLLIVPTYVIFIHFALCDMHVISVLVP